MKPDKTLLPGISSTPQSAAGRQCWIFHSTLRNGISFFWIQLRYACRIPVRSCRPPPSFYLHSSYTSIIIPFLISIPEKDSCTAEEWKLNTALTPPGRFLCIFQGMEISIITMESPVQPGYGFHHCSQAWRCQAATGPLCSLSVPTCTTSKQAATAPVHTKTETISIYRWGTEHRDTSPRPRGTHTQISCSPYSAVATGQLFLPAFLFLHTS